MSRVRLLAYAIATIEQIPVSARFIILKLLSPGRSQQVT